MYLHELENTWLSLPLESNGVRPSACPPGSGGATILLLERTTPAVPTWHTSGVHMWQILLFRYTSLYLGILFRCTSPHLTVPHCTSSIVSVYLTVPRYIFRVPHRTSLYLTVPHLLFRRLDSFLPRSPPLCTCHITCPPAIYPPHLCIYKAVK